MLFLGLGTGLGSTLIANRVIIPVELARLPLLIRPRIDSAATLTLLLFKPAGWRIIGS